MIDLPPIRIAIGEPFAHTFTLQGQNWTGYTGEVVFKLRIRVRGQMRPGLEALVTVTATGSAAGEVNFALTAEQTRALPALDRTGFYAAGVYQVRMTGPDVVTFQGDFGTAAEL